MRGRLHPTPEMLELVYTLLCLTYPFKGWKMPHADDVAFHVVHMKDQADCQWDGNRHVIRIAANRHASFASIIATMAHEMLHIHLDLAFPRDRASHGKRFQERADAICRHHTFDRGQF